MLDIKKVNSLVSSVDFIGLMVVEVIKNSQLNLETHFQRVKRHFPFPQFHVALPVNHFKRIFYACRFVIDKNSEGKQGNKKEAKIQ